MKTISTILILACISLLLPSCRYEDGPVFSLRSKASRIIGRKVIAQYKHNGIDSTNALIQKYSTTTCFDSGIDWLGPVELSQVYCISGTTTGYWELSDSKNELFLRVPVPNAGGVYFPEGWWTITRLTESDLWVYIEENSQSYHLRFKKLEL